MKKWLFKPTAGNIALILLGTGVNLLGGWAATRLLLPIWLDSVGTFISAALLGPIAGAISGALMNVIAGFFDPGQFWFALVSIAGGVAVGLFFPRGRRIEAVSVIATAQIAGLVMTIVSLPLNLYFNDGYVGHPWGDALVDMLAPYMSFRALRCLLGGLLVNMPDKALSIAVAMLILYFVRRGHDKKAAGKTANVLLALLISAASCAALITPTHAAADFGAEYASAVYGREDGLVAAEINAIAQTSDGYIWAGAYSGLYRCNGTRFELMQLDERISNAMCLYEDNSGRLWIGTNDSGLACYRTETGDVAFYTLQDGLASDSVRALCGDGEGGVYVGTAAGLCRVHADGRVHAFSAYPQLSGVRSLDQLWDGWVVGVTESGELFVLRGEELVVSIKNEASDASFTAAAYDGGGRILVGTSASELVHFSVNGNGRLEMLRTLYVEGMSDVNRIRFIHSEGGYFAASSTGIVFVDRYMNTKLLVRDDFCIAISDVVADYQHNIWFSSSKQGVMKLSPIPFLDVYRKVGRESTAANALLLDGKQLYVGTDQGLDLINTTSYSVSYNAATELLAGERVRHLMRDRYGNIWISTYGQHGLVCVKPNGSVLSFDGDDEKLLGNRFRFSVELSDGTILAASTEGLNFIRDGSVRYVIGKEQGMTLPKILSAVECPDGTIMAGSDGDGVYVIRDGAVIGHIGTEEGLLSLVILRIVPCGEGYIYVTSNGLYFHDLKAPVRRLKSFPYNNNYDVYIADDGNAWVTSSAGVYVCDAQKLVEDGEYPCVLLDYNRGFDTTLTANAWYAAQDDELYLCCADGIRRINTKTFNEWNNSYKIVMASITVDGEPVEYRDGAYQLPAGQGRIELWPAVLNYAISNPLVSIHMEGIDDRGVLVHQNEMNSDYHVVLPYGDYAVHVEVLDELSGNVRKEAYFPLHKDAELYERTFYRVYLVLVTALFVAFLAWTIAKMSNMALINRQYEQIKEAKEEAEFANRAKSRFLANMSHEIRTPINAVLGMDEMILRESSEPEIRDYAADIYTAGNTLLSLINDILDSSKIESGKMEIVPVEYELPTLVRDLYNMVSQRAQAKDLKLELEVCADLPRGLFGDDVRVRQVVTNILTNAVKYTPSGTVWFRVGGRRDGEDVLLHIEVEDTGIGIKEEDLPKLFEAFQRIEEGRNRNIEGTGLGMNITLQLLDMMGSKLEVESEYGKGSKFFFDLRQKVTDDTPVGNITDQEHRKGERCRREGVFIAPEAKVLVVDDNAMNRKVFRSLLKQTQMQIAEASGGAEALELARAERYDLVFMDHMLPNMDGVEAMQRMRDIEGYDAVPILALTANAVTGAKERYLELGFDGFISKPVVADRLEAAICEMLPTELLKPFEAASAGTESAGGAMPDDLPTVDGLDWGYAWLHLPERELLESTLREFRDVLELQAEKLDEMYRRVQTSPTDADALAAYRIQVHGMKSAAATVGVVPLAGMAKMLEFAARDADTATMERLHGVFLAEWRSYGDKLNGVFATEEAETEKDNADAGMLYAMLDMLKTALADFDVDAADEVMGKIRSYAYAPEVEELLPRLSAAVTDLDEDAAGAVMERLQALMQNCD